jgi:hypothetical protein
MPGLSYELGLDARAATDGVKLFSSSLTGLNSIVGKVGSALGVVGISLAAFKSASGFADSLKSVAESGRELVNLHNITGQSISDLVTLKKVAQENGMSLEGMTENIGMLSRSLGGVSEAGNPTAVTFARLGLSMKKLAGESAIQQVTDIGKAISRLGTQAEKASAVQEAFGRGGMQMLAVFSNMGSIDDAKASMGAYGRLMQRDALMFKEISASLESLSGKVKGFFRGFLDEVGPVLLPLLNRLKNFDLTGIGQQAGAIVKTVAAAFSSGQIGELVGVSLQIGAVKFGNALLEGITGFASAYGAYWAMVIQDWQALFENLPSVWAGIKEGMIGAFQAAGAVLLEIFNKPIVALQSGIEYALQSIVEKMPQGLKKLLGFGGGIEHESYAQISARRTEEGANLFGNGAGELAASSQGHFSKSAAAFKEATGGISIKDQLNGITQAFKDGMEGGKLLDDSGLTGSLKDLADKINSTVAKIPQLPDVKTGGAGGGSATTKSRKSPTSITCQTGCQRSARSSAVKKERRRMRRTFNSSRRTI